MATPDKVSLPDGDTLFHDDPYLKLHENEIKRRWVVCFYLQYVSKSFYGKNKLIGLMESPACFLSSWQV